jgi:uncharacterized protein (DUF58 family)
MLGTTLLVLLLASINFQLNLGYALTFLLAGCSVVGMHMGHATLRGLHLQLLPPPAQFLDAAATVTVRIYNPARRPRYGVGMALAPDGGWSWTEIPALGSAEVKLAWVATHRGLVALPLIKAETRFPMGAFRVWTLWQPAALVWIYPRPEASAPEWPAAQAGDSGGTPVAQRWQSGDHHDGLRSYRRGDPPKHIVWKKVAQATEAGSGTLVSREASHTQVAEVWFDLASTGLTDKESRLSRLCAWVCRADSRGLRYGLRLPAQHIAPSRGAEHQRMCLEALALC